MFEGSFHENKALSISVIEQNPVSACNQGMKSVRLLITLVLAAGIVGYVVWKTSQTGVAEVKLVGFQAADEPLRMPANGKPDMRFHMLSAWQANQIPPISKMDTPMGSENGALVYNAQKFWEMNKKRGGHHTGDDLNGIGGMNTDLGDPVFASANGLVIFAGEPSPGWGNVVVLAHKDSKGKPVRTMYAHLNDIRTTLDSLVARGEIIGTVGTANGYYPAHLHFELSLRDGIPIGSGYVSKPLARLDPAEFIATLHDPGPEGITPAPCATPASPQISLGHPFKSRARRSSRSWRSSFFLDYFAKARFIAFSSASASNSGLGFSGRGAPVSSCHSRS